MGIMTDQALKHDAELCSRRPVALATKLALLLALTIGALVLCEATTGPPPSETFNCPRGTAVDGNNRQQRAVPRCAEGFVLCRADDCNDDRACAAHCTDGTKLTLSRDSVGVVTTLKDGKPVADGSTNGFYKGCNAYCIMRTWVPAYVPLRKDGSPCGLSHADFCYQVSFSETK